jgi:hypothetical protein
VAGAYGYLTWRCADQCYSGLPGWSSPTSAREGERAALRQIAALAARCPEASLYTVTWDEPGTKFGGVRPHVTAYDRRTGVFWDANEPTGRTLLHLSDVRTPDIMAVADRSGGFDELRHRVLPREKLAAETQARQLQDAVLKGDVDRARRLLGQGADVNSVPYARNFDALYPEDRPPLVIAVVNNDVPMVRLLLKHGAEVKRPGPFGAILNHVASAKVAALLIEHGAEVNAPASSGVGGTERTALMWAAAGGNAEMVRYLLARGAKAAEKNRDGKTALDLAREAAIMGHDRSEVIGVLEQQAQRQRK